MRLTIEQPSYGAKVIIEQDSDDLTFEKVIEDLVRPALIAIGYHPNTVSDYFDPDESDPNLQS